MQRLDWIVLGVYLAAIVAIGVWAGRKNRRIDDFFLAGREMRWWAVGLSVMATQISAITFIGTTGQAYTDGMRFLTTYYGLPFAMVILCVTFVPFFYRARVYTAYEYLEQRFDARTRTLTSLLFLCSRGLSVGVVLYTASLTLAVILGRGERETVLWMAGLTIVYLLRGGNRSVIWTDVFQMGVVWFGIFVCLGVALTQLPADFGVRDALALAQASGRLNAMDTDFSLTKPYTLWTGLIGGMFLALAYFGTDQSQVQRYLSGSSLTQSRLALMFTAFLKVPMQFMILLTGVLIFVFYHFHPAPLLWNRAELQRLEARADPVWLARTVDRFDGAQAAREAALRVWTEQRHAGRTPEIGAYDEAEARLQAVRHEALAEAGRLEGRPSSDTNHIFPTYVVTHLPRGLAGLVIAVIFAAAMSAMSGELSSLATATMIDFYKPYVRSDGGERHELLMSRIFTAAWAGFACLVAVNAGGHGSAIELVNKLGSWFYGPILGVFLLATLTRAKARGAFWGLWIGEALVQILANLTPVHWLWWIPAGALSVVATGLILSRVGPHAETT